MGIRRRVRAFRGIIILSALMQFVQGGYQIKTIPHNSLMIATNKGFSAFLDENEFQNFSSFDIIRFPDNINFFKVQYNKISLSVLNFGTLRDQIDNQIFNQFDAYEADLQYYLKKNIINKFLFNANIGISYSKISILNSCAIISNFKLSSSIPESNINFAALINNLGFVLNDYTNKKTILPLNFQGGILYKLYQTSIMLSYDLIYQYHSEDSQHIASIQIPIGQNIKINLSSSSYRNELLIGDYQYDWFYGLGCGLSIQSKNITTNISVSNLGTAGFIYGMSLKRILN